MKTLEMFKLNSQELSSLLGGLDKGTTYTTASGGSGCDTKDDDGCTTIVVCKE